MKVLNCFVWFLLLLLIPFSGVSFAHKLSAFAYREGNKIMGEAYFSGGTPCKHCKVEIFDKNGKKIQQGFTNQKGEFSLKVKNKGKLKIVINGGEGHLATFILEAEKSEQETTTQVAEENATSMENTTNKTISTTISTEELKKIVEKDIEEKVIPRLEMLSSQLMDIRKQMDRAGVMDIIGGIGYIFGIWGIIALLKSRKKI